MGHDVSARILHGAFLRGTRPRGRLVSEPASNRPPFALQRLIFYPDSFSCSPVLTSVKRACGFGQCEEPPIPAKQLRFVVKQGLLDHRTPSAMTERDIGVVCSVLDRMTEGAVQSLTEANIWWLPHIKSVPKQEANGYIRNALTSFSDAHQRLLAIAWLYCCLAEREALERWRTYCFSSGSAALVDRFSLPDRLASLLKKQSDCTLYEKVEREDTVYACIMTAQAPPAYCEHNVLCFCIPRTIPYVFLHVLDSKASYGTFLQKAFEHPIKELQVGRPCRDLDYAVAKARQMN
ncbi:hypothetical protein MTO96_034167 [Rhipicephalus appendiculatus]